jgi:histone-lysine N-methyltransferase SETD8
MDGKGLGVRAYEDIPAGHIVFHYRGELLRGKLQIAQREQLYEETDEGTSLIFHFKWRGMCYARDATNSEGIARCVNHSKKNANLKPFVQDTMDHKKKEVVPVLFFKTTRAIAKGEELLFDYGDRSKKATEAFPWLLE